MSQIHIARHGQSLGSFSEEEIKEGIQSQRFVGEDLSWRSGMSDWRPLEETAVAWGFDAVPSTALTAEGAELPLLMEPAWERRSELGFFQALIRTIGAVLWRPGITFSKLKVDGGLLGPLFYYLLMVNFNFIALCYQMPSILKNPTLLSSQLEGVSQHTLILVFFIVWIVSPLFFTVGIFISSFLMHLSIKLIVRTNEPFQATFRTMAYAVGSASVVQLIPFIGGIVSAIWGLITYFIGLKKVHRVSSWRLFFSILFSVILFIAFYLLIIVLVSIAMTYLPGHSVLPKAA